jgi:hypothetical protein
MRTIQGNGTFVLLILLLYPVIAIGQGMPIGELMIFSTSGWKQNPDAIRPAIRNESTNKDSEISMRLFQADRGKRKGDFLLVCSVGKATDRKMLPSGSPFMDKETSFGNTKEMSPSNYLAEPEAYTEYQLIGADRFDSLPTASLLGIHYIKVKKDRAADFERFVIDKLHPTVGQLLPDMKLLYYKAVAGENAGSYITIFTIASYTAREKFWPAGKAETDSVKQAFLPLRNLGRELAPYLVDGSYLEESSGGAAAYFESKEWTDFLVVSH